MTTSKPKKTALTAEIIAKLKAERERTSTGPKALLKPYKELPKGLNHPMVTHWLGGRIKTARENHLKFVLNAWEKLPDVETIELTDELLEELRALQKASGVTPEMMVRWGNAGALDLSVSNIKHYLSGNSRHIRFEHLTLLKRAFSGSRYTN